MKKILLSGILATMSCMLMAQAIQEKEAVMVYYMPRTELVLHLQYNITAQTPGVFYQYAKRYLGAENIITEASSTYTLKNIDITTNTSADLNRSFQVYPQKGIQTQLISLTEDGRLQGYNATVTAETATKENETKVANTNNNTPTILPLLEEQFIAGTTAKMAEGAAKQIYRIREMRLNLLAGEVEHVPADGKAMQLVLDELNKREAELVALFVGTTTTQTGTHTIYYTPQNSKKQEVVCRFSQHTGVVSSNDLSGSPIYLNLSATKPTLEDGGSASAKAPIVSQIYYNLPGHVTVAAEYNGNTMYKGTHAIAQFGVEIPLAIELFMLKPAPSILFNTTTGNIQSIKQ